MNKVLDSACIFLVAASSTVALMNSFFPSILSNLALKIEQEFANIGLLNSTKKRNVK